MIDVLAFIVALVLVLGAGALGVWAIVSLIIYIWKY